MRFRLEPFCLLLLLATDAAAASCDRLTATVQAHARKDAAQKRPEESAHSLQILYGQNAAACNRQLAEIVDIYRTAYTAAQPKRGWWQEGWIAAAILAVLLLFRDFLLKLGAAALEWLRKTIYNRFAGSRLFRRTAIRRYRTALYAKYEHVVVGFRPDIKLKMRDIYVPVRARRSVEATSGGRDAISMVSALRRSMVVGPPGSGKSMLLRSVAFQFSERTTSDRTIPVLVELNRFNEGTTNVFETVVDVFRLNDFPRAENFVRAALERGDLFLLFDGLDEVNTDRRELVVKSVTDFLDEHEKCRSMITCRVQVYRNEFSALVDETLEVVEFDDFQIRRFLTSWQPYLPSDKTVDQLIQTLRTRPRIMALARNPLLLTIVAFLYTEPAFALPHSRAEFYDQAIDALLLPKGKRNQYKAPHKKLVLQHLALYNHDSGTANQSDRRTIELPQVIQEIKKVLPSLNLKVEDAEAVLDEIVERSGLLLSIDGGARIAFAHLTLQEFFAAAALADDVAALSSRFEADPDAWREVAKLWCGFDHDSTKLIGVIYESHPITAFECLADAQKIDPELADRIVKNFQRRLAEGEADEAVARAFGAVASDHRPRGAAAFDFLVRTLDAAISTSQVRLAAAEALAATNLPAAAQRLAAHAAENPDARPALLSLGDLAVPHLGINVTPFTAALSCRLLRDIGTPQAAAALVQYLDSGTTAATEAAWYICGLLRRPEIEESLRMAPLPPDFGAHSQAEWVWAPYDGPSGSVLATIVGRCAELMLTHPPMDVGIDPRVAVPLAIKAAETERVADKRWIGKALREKLSLYTREDFLLSQLHKITARNELERMYQTAAARVIDDELRITAPLLATFMRSVPEAIRLDFAKLLTTPPIPTTSEWTAAFRRRQYSFDAGIHLKILIALGLVLSLAAAIACVKGMSPPLLSFVWGVSTAAAWSVVFSDRRFRQMVPGARTGLQPRARYLVIAVAWCFPLALGVIFLISDDQEERRKMKSIAVRSILLWPWLPATLYLANRLLLTAIDAEQAILVWSAMAGAVTALIGHGLRTERKAKNPLHHLVAQAFGQPASAAVPDAA